jgi:hypothetical protein
VTRHCGEEWQSYLLDLILIRNDFLERGCQIEGVARLQRVIALRGIDCIIKKPASPDLRQCRAACWYDGRPV